MTDVVEEFLTALADRGYEPLLAKTSGALAVHLVGGPHPNRWVLAVDKGNVTVAADATITLDRPLFERMVQGRANAMTAVLRGAAKIDGDLDLLMAIQRVFPGPNDGGADQGESRP